MWWSYEDARERKARLQREIAKRQKKGEVFEILAAPAGQKKLTVTFWGQAWCRNLEAYQQYESRLPRGRSYLRQGHVYNLRITPGSLTAVVAGSELYDVKITIQPLGRPHWQRIVESCTGQVGSMLDLLAGKLGDGVLQVLTDRDQGLFPKPREIRFNCSCPDFADMCKHVSALLYGVGVLLDSQPELLFTLRGVDQAELLTEASSATLAGLDGAGAADALAGADLSALFGIDLAAEAAPAATPSPAKPRKAARKEASKAARKAPVKKSAPPRIQAAAANRPETSGGLKKQTRKGR